MPSEKLYREFQNLERKIQLVLNENKRLKEELSLSRKENGTLKEQLSSYASNLNSFQNQMKINKLANNMVVRGEDSAQLKGMIEDYIKEIDKCIAHLAE
jgi:septal ring factor EnvC (AmiA/AmiB activator)